MLCPRLVLASASSRRQQLLQEAGYRFEVRPADIDESVYPAHLSPGELASYLAEQKAIAVSNADPVRVVLAADTVVALGEDLFGKPLDLEHARTMLSRLSGTVHQVLTGVSVRCSASGFLRNALGESSVQMRQLSDSEIEAYLATGQWQGKAGGYGIQDPDPFVTRITGSLTNIVGLPMEIATELLAEAGIRPGE